MAPPKTVFGHFWSFLARLATINVVVTFEPEVADPSSGVFLNSQNYEESESVISFYCQKLFLDRNFVIGNKRVARSNFWEKKLPEKL